MGFRMKTYNWSLNTETRLQEAAARHTSCSGQLRRKNNGGQNNGGQTPIDFKIKSA